MRPSSSLSPSIQDHYTVIEKIGAGCYSEVFKAVPVNRESPVVALKRSLTSADSGIKYTTVREALLLNVLIYDHIAKLIEVQSFPGETYLVLEYVEYDLIRFRQQKLKQLVSIDVMKSFMYQLFMAVSFIHSKSIIHRDLKPQNILVSPSGILKVADFGLARFYHEQNICLTPRMVTILYRAPELLLGWQDYTSAVDVWSCACIFAEFVSGHPLFFDERGNDPAQLEAILKCLGLPRHWSRFDRAMPALVSRREAFPNQPNWSHLLPGIDDQGRDLIAKCLALNPDERISASEALQHPFFDEVRC